MRTRVHLTGAVALAVSASALFTVQASAGAPVPRAPDRGAHPRAAHLTAEPAISWHPCPEAPGTLCGTLHVPLDWARPGGARVALAVARRPADDPSRRIGTLLYNHGGPGEGAVQYVVAADRVFSRTLRERFDIVGLDPRATGGSVRVSCGVSLLAPDVTLFPRTPAQFDRLRRQNRDVGRSCLNTTGPLLAHLDTVTVARDHDALRRALGERQVSWLGLSYGTQVAANYAELFSRQTRAMVLDAALEHSLPEVVQVAQEAMAAEDSFNRFLAWCRTAPTCALRGQDVGRRYDALVARADRHPIPVEGALRPVTGEDIRLGTIGLLRFKEPSIFGPDLSWAGLSRAIKGALAGDARGFALPPPSTDPESFALIAIGCQEYQPQVGSFAQMRQRIRLGREIAPHLQGAAETWQVNRCIDWPVPPANPPRTLHVRGVPTLVVHATHDPSVPYPWAHSLAAQIEGAALLTRVGDGHTSSHTSPCAIAAIDRYLVRPTAPADRTCHD